MASQVQSISDDVHQKLYRPLPCGWTRVVQLTQNKDLELPVLKLYECQLVPNDTGDGWSPLINSQQLKYVALSYVWGDGDERTPVSIDILDADDHCHTITLTRSLRDALPKLAKHVKQFRWFLWVDQISINQSSMSERSLQIGMMKQIYETASLVVSWLGQAKDDSDLAFSTILSFRHSWDERFPSHSESMTAEERAKGLSEFVQEIVANTSNKQWDAIARLLDRPWFGRAWIRQEATAGNYWHGLVTCGQSSALLRAFQPLLMIVPEVEYHTRRLLRVDRIQQLVMFAIRRRDLKDRMPLISLVRELRSCAATDLRDKIFCMLSFATDVRENDRGFAANYSETTRETFTRFALWCIANYRSLDILGDCVRFFQYKEESAALPTWAPDWSHQQVIAPFHKIELANDPTSRPLFRASGDYGYRVSFPGAVTAFSAAKYLILEGLQVGKVQKVLEPDSKGQDSPDDLSTVRSWAPKQTEKTCLLNKIPLKDVFSKTVFADVVYIGVGFPRRYRRGAESDLSFESIRGVRRSDLKFTTFNRSLFYTSTHLMGLGPGTMLPGDEVWMLRGGRPLYVLRPQGHIEDVYNSPVFDLTNSSEQPDLLSRSAERQVHQLVGECFMLGLMDGELVEMMGNPLQRPIPPPLRDMDRKFRTVYLA